MKILAVCILAFSIIATKASAQDYLDAKTMKLTEVSTDKSYGYEMRNPVKVGAKEKAADAFINALKGPSGEKILLNEKQENVKGKTGVNAYILSLEGKSDPVILYLSVNELIYPKCPLGLAPKTIKDIPYFFRVPFETIVKVSQCDAKNIYVVDDLLLKEKVGDSLPLPDKNSTYKGGIEELKKYFAEHPVIDDKAKQSVFRVSIAFVVSCDGKAGNYEIITHGRGDLETFANFVLDIVNKMPQNWQAATKDGKTVDSYQVLTFTVVQGKLDKVLFR